MCYLYVQYAGRNLSPTSLSRKAVIWHYHLSTIFMVHMCGFLDLLNVVVRLLLNRERPEQAKNSISILGKMLYAMNS